MREEKSGQRKENGPSSEIKSEQKKTEKIDGKNSEKDGWRKKMPRGRVVSCSSPEGLSFSGKSIRREPFSIRNIF